MSNSKGFSLVTLAIIIVAFSAAIVGLMSYNQAYPVMDRKIRDVSDLNATMATIQKFAISKNLIPCPADPRLPESDINYLKSAGTFPSCSTSMPNKSGIYFKGLVPTRTLGINDSSAFNANKNYISYLVGRGLSFFKVNTNGTCVTKDGSLNSGCAFSNSSQFQQFSTGEQPNAVLISHGESGIGSFKKGLTSTTTFAKSTHQISAITLPNNNKFDSLPQAANSDLYLSGNVDDIIYKSSVPLGNPATTSSTGTKVIYDNTVVTAKVSMGGNVKCWGSTAGNRSDVTPTSLATDKLVKAVSTGGGNACALKTDNTISCWGDNTSGQNTVPVGLTAKAVVAGYTHSCAINMNDYVQCWGGNANNELSIPAAIAQGTGTEKVKEISSGAWHTCALTVAGNVKCWGKNTETQINVPTSPVNLGTAGVVKSIATGFRNSCAIKTDDTVVCWGDDYVGKLQISSMPADINADGVSAISVGYYTICAIKKNTNQIKCWGGDDYSLKSTAPTTANNVKLLTLEGYHGCIIREDDSAQCWGWNVYGEASTATNSGNPTPTLISTEIMRSIDAGWGHNCYIKY